MELWSLKKNNILIIDDYSEMRSMMKQIVISLGAININTARNGEDAIALMRSHKFDIVLCDYNLGDNKDGQQILEEARHLKLISDNTLFFMITAENTSFMVMGAIEYAPDDYLSKPITKIVLQARLRRLMDAKNACADILKSIDKKEYDTALTLIDEATNFQSNHRYKLLKIRGELLCKLERYIEAEQLYEEILEERELGWALLGLGQVYYHADRFSDAEDIFEQLLELNENYMPAYDWLAKTTEALGDKKRTQSILLKATTKSPKSILRHRRLAEISVKLDDHETSEQAFKQAVEHGRHSCFKSTSDYSGLSKSYLEQGKTDRALSITKKLSRDYPGNDSVKLMAIVLESNAHLKAGNQAAAEDCISRSVAIFNENPEKLSGDMAMQLAENCLKGGRIEDGEELIKYVVRNNHDNSTVIAKAQILFTEAGLEEKGKNLISSTCNEIIQLNNEGVQLAEQGKFTESIALFIKAAKAMPENIAINLNAAQSIILDIVKNSAQAHELTKARNYLDRVEKIDKDNEKLDSLNRTYNNLSLKIK